MAETEFIGKYKIMGLVAQGGMGAVYKAVHPTLKRLVILKKLTIRGNATMRERFKREAQILLDMQSPYIVHLFDYFVEGNSHYIVEEFVDGLSLAQVIQKQVSLSTELSLLIFLDACYALKFAHARGIVHRDIKPGNILISRRAEVKLADFGIASSDDIEEISVTQSDKIVSRIAEDVTQTGVTLGTPAYMSPEQISDSRSVDNRADIYSMGVMLYEMLTGTKPFGSSTKRGRYINPKKLDPSIPSSICRMIKKMLRPKPNQRYKSIDAVINIVKKYLSEYDTHAIRISLAQIIISKKQFEVPRFEKRRHIGAKITAGIISAALLFAAGYYTWNEGYIHKTLLKAWYRGVTLNLTTPVTGIQNNLYGTDIPVKAYFFDETDPALPEVKGSVRDFKTSAKTTAKKNVKLLSTKPLYLKKGSYRVKVLAGSYVMWSSFKVQDEDLELNFDSLQKVKRPVQVEVKAFDAESGKDLSSQAVFTVLQNGKYLPLSEVESDSLLNGKVMKIRVECEGYKTKEFSMIIDWYQDTLFVNASLSSTFQK